MRNYKVERLQAGDVIISKERGNSMIPLIYSNQEHELTPILLEDVKVGDIVYCKVAGRHFTHLVTAICPKRGLQISNNKGFVNGWTKVVYGKVTKVF